MALIPQCYEDAVVALGIENNGIKRWIATGFIVARKNEAGGYNTFLVTNKHVFNGFNSLLVRFNIVGKIDARDFKVDLIKDGVVSYSIHTNPNVDVACLLLNPVMLSEQLGGLSAFELDNMSLSWQEMIENDVIEGTSVFSLGFPSGLVGVDTKAPLCRIGCIARNKEKINAEGYLLDIQNFPGSSGSPVINKIDANCLNGTKSFNRTALIGILASYIPYKDILYSRQTGLDMQIIQENSGIAIAFTVDAIKEVVEIEFNRVNQLERKVEPNTKDPDIAGEQNETTDQTAN